ncbi:MAG TPA: biotin--[acetyl-CoA-carboxylase] ligase [Cyanobacteria bacterium UBA11372]|nr:biotin--[acetyl-CoA-carboxylase] ligase [Cyanobacteria bacterium UBA11372]
MEFNRQKFIAAIGASPQETPLNFHIFETVASTNQTLWQLLAGDAPPRTVVIATQQTAGRGQWGRHWQSEPGGLYLSLALSPNLPSQLAAGLTLCSAWGIATALRDKGIPVWLKWPNDLVLSGRKLGGILTETRVHQGKIAQAVVGVGINWANWVPETGINLQSFLANNPVSPITSLEILAAVTLMGIVSGYEYWQQEGIEHLLPAYENLLTNMGQKVTVDGQAGVVVGVGASGDLRVQICETGVAAPVEISVEPGTISLGYR